MDFSASAYPFHRDVAAFYGTWHHHDGAGNLLILAVAGEPLTSVAASTRSASVNAAMDVQLAYDMLSHAAEGRDARHDAARRAGVRCSASATDADRLARATARVE